MEFRKMVTYVTLLQGMYVNPVCETAKEAQMYRTVFWTVGEGKDGMI